MANLAGYTDYGTMRVKTVELRSSGKAGRVRVVEPYTRGVLLDDTVANVLSDFQTKINYGVYPFLKIGSVRQYLARGLELRGVQLGLSTSAISSVEPISASVSIPGR
jgi:hypothetical protein